MGWPKSSFGFFRNILLKNPNELLGQPNSKEASSCYDYFAIVSNTVITQYSLLANGILSLINKQKNKQPYTLISVV